MPNLEGRGRATTYRRILATVGVLGVLVAGAPSAAETFTAVTGSWSGADGDALASGDVGAADIGKHLASGPDGTAMAGGNLAGGTRPNSTTTDGSAKEASAPALKALPTTSLGDTGDTSALRGSRRSTGAATTAAPTSTTTAAPTTTAAAPTTTAAAPKTPVMPAGPRVDVTAYGATPDDGKDDQAAIEAALDATPAGGVLVFAPGTYQHSHSVEVHRDGVTLWGYGASLDGTNREDHAIVLIGDRTNLFGFTIFSHPSGRMNAEEQMGVSVRGSDGSTVRDNTVRNTSSAGIFIWNAANYKVLNNVVQDTMSDGIHSTGGAHHGLVEGNVLRNVGDDCFAVVSYISERQMSNNITIRNNSCVGGKARGLSVVGGTDVVMVGNRIEASAAAGAYFASEPSYETYAAKRVQLIGNTFIGVNTNKAIGHGGIFVWGRAGTATTADGTVYTLQNEDILIKGNVVTDTIVGTGHIVLKEGYSYRVNIADNVLTGSKSATDIGVAGNRYNLVRNTYNGAPLADHVGDAGNLP